MSTSQDAYQWWWDANKEFKPDSNTVWNAAVSWCNNRAGDAANEAEKYQRRVEAVGAILDRDHELTQEQLIAIIAKAQG